MIQIEPKITRQAMSMPNASASTLLVLSGGGGDVQEKHQVNTHLCDGEHDNGYGNAGAVNQMSLRGPEGGHRHQASARPRPMR